MDGKEVDTVVVQKAVCGRKLNRTEQKENRAIFRIRARGKHTFAVMSGQAGQARHAAAIPMMNLCCHLQRDETIRRLQLHPIVPT